MIYLIPKGIFIRLKNIFLCGKELLGGSPQLSNFFIYFKRKYFYIWDMELDQPICVKNNFMDI